LEPAVSVTGTTLTQSVIGELLYPQTTVEFEAGVTPASFAGASRPWVDAVERYGLVGDGATNNDDAFERMLSVGGQALFIRRGDYVIHSAKEIPSNTTIYLEPGTIIRDGGVLPEEGFIRLEDVENVHIIGYGAKLLMDRNDYTTGEQRHGLQIRGSCTNICVEGLESSNMGGDGFFVGTNNGAKVPTNVRILNCKADNNRRQGMSITCARDLLVFGGSFTRTSGTLPQSGIDIEPDSPTYPLERIRLVNVHTGGNADAGILIYLDPIDSTSNPVSIDIVNHHDVGSDWGAVVRQVHKNTKGYIRFHAPVWQENNQYGFGTIDHEAGGILTEVFDPLIIDPNQNGSTDNFIGCGMTVCYGDDAGLTNPIGGVHIYRPAIRVTGTQQPTVAFYAQNTINAGEIEDVKIIDPKEAVWSVAPTYLEGPVYVRDPEHVMRLAVTSGTSVSAVFYRSLYTNEGATGSVTLNLAGWYDDGREQTFEVHESQNLVLVANAIDTSLRIFPGSYTSLQSNEVGAKITLKPGEGGFWITNMVGAWHASGTTWTISNELDDYAFDADSVTTAELADVVATLIKKLRFGA
ncbi:MAG TPA: hypothetical protein VF201_15005, partial [Nitrolancea sp.]